MACAIQTSGRNLDIPDAKLTDRCETRVELGGASETEGDLGDAKQRDVPNILLLLVNSGGANGLRESRLE
jgi:hypothetical protein